jgi:phage major head subunit gpT-like protein
MAVTSAQLLALYTSIKARFNAGLVLGKKDWQMIAKAISSEGASNTYEWMSQFPAFREWVGNRLHKAIAETAYTVNNRKFENTLDIPMEKLEDGNYGQYGDVAESWGQSVTDLENQLIFQLLKDGFSAVCYDGQYFFDTEHPVTANEDGSGAVTNVSNMQAGTGEPWVLLCTERAPKPFYLQERVKAKLTSVFNPDNPIVYETDAVSFGGRWRGNGAYGFWQLAFGSKANATVDNFEAAYKAMMKMKGDGGRLIGVTPDLLVCGPDNQCALETILKAQQNAAGASNINYNKVKLQVTPWLAL